MWRLGVKAADTSQTVVMSLYPGLVNKSTHSVLNVRKAGTKLRKRGQAPSPNPQTESEYISDLEFGNVSNNFQQFLKSQGDVGLFPKNMRNWDFKITIAVKAAIPQKYVTYGGLM